MSSPKQPMSPYQGGQPQYNTAGYQQSYGQQPQYQPQYQPQQYGQPGYAQGVPVQQPQGKTLDYGNGAYGKQANADFAYQGQQQGAQPVEGVPLYPEAGPAAQRFVVSGYRDVWAMILFGLMIVASIGVAAYNGKSLKSSEPHLSEDGKDTLNKFKVYLPASFGVSLAISAITLTAMRAFARQFIIIANVMVIVLNILIAILAFTQGIIGMGVVWLLVGVLQGLWLYLVRNRIPFAAVLLRTSVTLIVRHYGTIVVSFGALLACVAYFAVWVVMGVPVTDRLADENVEAWVICAALGLLLCYYWATQVFTNVSHVTASGVVATWYFVGEASMPPAPSVASAKRATTTSFGSICFGSLVVAILKVLYFVARSAARHNNDLVACIMQCIIGILEQLMEYFNVYAFTHVAIYGTSYVQAAKQTWNMVKECGWAAYFNDCLVWPTLAMTSFFPSAAVGAGFGLAAWDVVVGIVCFFICYVVLTIALRPVYSGIVTQFVCVAEAADVMQSTNPAYHQAMEEATAAMMQPAC